MKVFNISLLYISKLKKSYCPVLRSYYKHNALHKTSMCLNNQVYRFLSIDFQTKNTTMSLKTNHLVFVYGTLKKGEPNHDLIEQREEGTVLFIGNAKTVKKWPLVIASRYNIPYLIYSEGKGKHVVGEVYEVDDVVLSKFDELEAHPEYYTRVLEDVQLISENDEKILKVWIYFLKNFRPELLDLPCLSDYSSEGSHGLKYVSSEETCKSEDIYT